MAWVATAIVGSAVIGGAVQAYSANKASNAQQQAAAQAAQTQLNMYNKTREDLEPYREIGKTASGEMTRRLTELTSPISVDPNELENSDYYQFTKTQGEKAAQNSAAARGLGKSGAAVKGALAFNQGLATNTYKTAFDMANTNQTNAYTRLKQLVDTGSNAAAQTGSAGSTAAAGAANAQIGAGNAEAAGINAIGSAANNVANSVGSAFVYKGLYGDRGSGGAMTYAENPHGGYSPTYA